MADLATDRCYCLPVTCDSGDLQWGLIELQGELLVQEEREGSTFPVGTLCQSDFVSSAQRDKPSTFAPSKASLLCRKVTLCS